MAYKDEEIGTKKTKSQKEGKDIKIGILAFKNCLMWAEHLTISFLRVSTKMKQLCFTQLVN